MTVLALVLGAISLDGAMAADERSLTPSEVVEAAYKAANAGRYDEADEHLDSAFNAPFFRGGDAKKWWNRKTAKRTLRRVDVVRADVKGDEARVTIRRVYADGRSDEETEQLVRKGTAWKISPVRLE